MFTFLRRIIFIYSQTEISNCFENINNLSSWWLRRQPLIWNMHFCSVFCLWCVLVYISRFCYETLNPWSTSAISSVFCLRHEHFQVETISKLLNDVSASCSTRKCLRSLSDVPSQHQRRFAWNFIFGDNKLKSPTPSNNNKKTDVFLFLVPNWFEHI